jgi:Domain of unknown function (DUF6766)
MRKITTAIRDNSLTIILFALFVACITGHSYAGWRLENETLAGHGRAAIGYGRFLVSGVFLEQLSANWQAAVLQLASLIVFSSFFYQRGAPHSRDPRKREKRTKRFRRRTLGWLYRHSLSLAFFALFAATLALHVFAGAAAYNQARRLAGQTPTSLAGYLISAQFWTATLQTWQAEYLVIALYIALSVFLREDRSAESKSIQSRDDTTGEANR